MTHDQDLARRLGETLHQRADALHDTPLDLLAVRGRATSIRRRRTAAAGLAVAGVVAAVVVPLSLLPLGGNDRGLDPQPADTITPIPEPVPLDPRSAPVGDAPRAPYVAIGAKQLVTPAGTYDLPEAYPQITPYGDGWIAVSVSGDSDTSYSVEVLDPELRQADGAAESSDLAVSEDGSEIAWVEFDGVRQWTLRVAPSNAEAESSSIPVARGGPRSLTRPVGFLPDGAVVLSTTEPVNASQTFSVVERDGTITPFAGFNHLAGSSSVSGLVGGQTQYLGDDSCSGVLDPLSGSGDLVWETCDHSLGAFSPDGRFVVGLADYSDGLGSPSVAILDATTGKPVVDFESGRTARSAAAVGDVVWEDATTLLATVTQGADQYLVRATIDGRVERVAGPEPVNMSTAFWFPTRPFG